MKAAFLSSFGYYSEGEWVKVSATWIIVSVILTIATLVSAFFLIFRHKKTKQPQPALGCLSLVLGFAAATFLSGVLQALWETYGVICGTTLLALGVLGFAIYKVSYKILNNPRRYAKMLITNAANKCDRLAFWLSMHKSKAMFDFPSKTQQEIFPYILCFYEYLIYLRQPWLYNDAKETIESEFFASYVKEFQREVLPVRRAQELRKEAFAHLDTYGVTHTGYTHEVWEMFYGYIINFGIVPENTPNYPNNFESEYEDLIHIRLRIDEIFNEKHRRYYFPFSPG